MKLSFPIYKLKRHARLMAREQTIPLHEALDRLAAAEGFRSWSHLAASATDKPADRLLNELSAGDLLLLAARPGQGKTLLAFELAMAASSAGYQSFFFTLDYTEADVIERLHSLGADLQKLTGSLVLDTSDEICAGHIVQRIGGTTKRAFVVVDYLQLLDQKRENPDIDTQIRSLRSFAAASGSVIVTTSQIDRSFDPRAKRLPGVPDVRLLNPLDLSLFTRTCFMHDGEVKLQAVA